MPPILVWYSRPDNLSPSSGFLKGSDGFVCSSVLAVDEPGFGSFEVWVQSSVQH